jgi:AcrR family transcriptional regulator
VKTVQERKRQAIVDHLVQAALKGLATLSVTVDEIARIAGVSRRTVFRYFPSRDELLAKAAVAGQIEFDKRLPRYAGDGEWRLWLSALCRDLHAAHGRFCPTIWEMSVGKKSSRRLAAAAKEMARLRRERSQTVGDTLWMALGQDGAVPNEFRGTIIAHLSPHFTDAVRIDAGGDHKVAASLAEAAIIAIAEKYIARRLTPAT